MTGEFETIFDDTDRYEITLGEEDILGTHVFEDVLYTGETGVVDVRTGETPERLDASVQAAREFVAETERPGRAPRVAKHQPPEQAVESGSAYTSSAFFHRDMTGSMEWHTVFRRAWESDEWEVDYTANYRTGELTITVSRSG